MNTIASTRDAALSVRIPRSLRNRIEQQARTHDEPLAAIVRRLLLHSLDDTAPITATTTPPAADA